MTMRSHPHLPAAIIALCVAAVAAIRCPAQPADADAAPADSQKRDFDDWFREDAALGEVQEYAD
jgi:hypothetical protein